MVEKENIFKRIILFILKKLRIIKRVEVDKKEMCKSIKEQGICNQECSCCIWNENRI